MAALVESPRVRVVDLRSISGEELTPLLEEEKTLWRDQLDWDFSASADLVIRFVSLQALSGYALLGANRVVGYSYYVTEDRKGLIGDVYVEPGFRSEQTEDMLLEATLEALLATPFVRRIESQLMMLRSPLERAFPQPRYLRAFRRQFMSAPLDRVATLPASSAARSLWFESWREERQDEVSQLIASAYQGHVDSEINDQYRSPSGARRFLQNIVQYPGCGAFFHPASLVAFDARTERICGVVLSSLVGEETGHITQICVSKEARGSGVGYELLRRCLLTMFEWGSKRVSLTVTSSNTRAIEMYQRMGFRILRQFSACVWDGFRSSSGLVSLMP
jgi:ribosomal protein S18 acetylase RimI-like enzyme